MIVCNILSMCVKMQSLCMQQCPSLSRDISAAESSLTKNTLIGMGLCVAHMECDLLYECILALASTLWGIQNLNYVMVLVCHEY